MDPSTETTLLLVLSLACVVALVHFPVKESKDLKGVQMGTNLGVRDFHCCGGTR